MKILCFLKRKVGLSRAEFIDYYEQRHVKLVAELLPFYTQYKRNEPNEVYAPEHLENDHVFDRSAMIIYTVDERVGS